MSTIADPNPHADDLAPLALVVATSRNHVIGRDGGLPWHLPEDLAHFRRVTTGHAIIIGRRTFDSLSSPLPDRTNIVMTRQRGLVADGFQPAHSLDEATDIARRTDGEPRICGGAAIYRLALPRVTRIFMTLVDEVVDGDTYFPELDRSAWREVEHEVVNGLHFLMFERY